MEGRKPVLARRRGALLHEQYVNRIHQIMPRITSRPPNTTPITQRQLPGGGMYATNKTLKYTTLPQKTPHYPSRLPNTTKIIQRQLSGTGMYTAHKTAKYIMFSYNNHYVTKTTPNIHKHIQSSSMHYSTQPGLTIHRKNCSQMPSLVRIKLPNKHYRGLKWKKTDVKDDKNNINTKNVK